MIEISQGSSSEVDLLNSILQTGNIVDPINSGVQSSFILYQDEWNWIRDYYDRYREVPPQDAFLREFKSFPTYKTNASIQFYIEELHKHKARRTLSELLTEAASSLKELGPYNTINVLNKRLARLGKETLMVRDLDLVNNAEDRLDNLRERLELLKSGKEIIGVPTGIKVLDREFGGWQKGDMVSIAAWTGNLKSYLALYSAMSAWQQGYRVLYFSLEMSSLQIGYRFDSLLSEGMFSHSSLTHAKEIHFDRYKTWLGESMRDKPPFVVVTNEDLDEINQNTVSAKIGQWSPHLVVIDYVQLMDDASGATGETEKLKNLSKALKKIAIKTGVPIIVITSVTPKDKPGKKPPELDELAWSKQLAYDSDLCLCLCKDAKILEVISRKNRRGGEIHFHMKWDFETGEVKEISPRVIQDDEDDYDEN